MLAPPKISSRLTYTAREEGEQDREAFPEILVAEAHIFSQLKLEVGSPPPPAILNREWAQKQKEFCTMAVAFPRVFQACFKF